MTGIDDSLQARWSGHVPGAESVTHGWLLEDGYFRLLAEVSVDVDAMPVHLPYSYFGVRREEMGGGPVSLSLGLVAGPDGRMGVARSWRPGNSPPLDQAAQGSLFLQARTGAMTGMSVAAPFTVPVAVLTLAGLLGGGVTYVRGTRSLVGESVGSEAAESYDAYATEARDALASVIGTEALGRLERISAMDWQPNEQTTHLLTHLVIPEMAQAALQAAETWPFLRPRIATATEALMDASGPHRPIDVAVRALGSGGSRAHLRRLAPVGDRLDIESINVLTRLPVDWLPRTSDDEAWEPLSDVARGCVQTAFLTGIPPAELLRDSKGQWGPYAKRIARAALPFADDPTVFSAFSHATDMAMSFERRLLTPALRLHHGTGTVRHRGAFKEALRLLIGQCALGQFAERIGRYDRNRETMAARLRATSPHVTADLAWVPFLPTWKDPATGLRIVPLADEAQLRAEGRHGVGPDGDRGLSHCVGEYGLPCAKGQSRILSVRRDGGTLFERVSTAEIVWADENGRPLPRIRQHTSHGNGRPSPEAVAALSAYVALGYANERPPAAPIPPFPPGARQAGYDIGVRANVETALALWNPMLPRTLRSGDLGEFVRAVEAQPTRHQASPRIPTTSPTASHDRLSV